jgi:hypothetical protein
LTALLGGKVDVLATGCSDMVDEQLDHSIPEKLTFTQAPAKNHALTKRRSFISLNQLLTIKRRTRASTLSYVRARDISVRRDLRKKAKGSKRY